MPHQHSQVSCVGVGQNVNAGNKKNIIRAQGIFCPPNGLEFLSIICKILREEFLLLRSC